MPKSPSRLEKAMKYLRGDSTVDIDEALSLLEQESKLGNSRAKFELAKAHLEYDSEPDVKYLVSLIEAAAKSGCGPAAYALWKLYSTGSCPECHLNAVFEPKPAVAENWKRLALEASHPLVVIEEARRKLSEGLYGEAEVLLGRFPEKPEYPFDKEDFQSAAHEAKEVKLELSEHKASEKRLSVLRKKAEKGDIEAAYILGASLLQSGGLPAQEGKRWLELASSKGHARAKHLLKD